MNGGINSNVMAKKNYIRKEIKIPLFNQQVVIFVFKELQDANEYFKFQDSTKDKFKYMGAGVFEDVETGIFVITYEATLEYGIVAHESLHCTKRILERLGVKDEETEAYTLQYIVQQTIEWIEKKELELNKL